MKPSRLLPTCEHVLFWSLVGFAWYAGNGADDVAPSSKSGVRARFRLTEVSASRGVVFEHRAPRVDPRLGPIEPHVAGMGAAVSVVDYDGDGWADLYATTSEFGRPNALFRNRGDGTFEDVAAEVGLADVNREAEGASTGSVWADLDNDGDLDCYLYKWGHAQLFLNEGGRFRDATEGSGLRRWMNANAAAWIDYDRDGLVDLYAAGYFRDETNLFALETTRIMQESFEFADNGGHNYLYRNLGGGRFEDVTAAQGVDSTRWTLAVAAADLDGDGWQDLYLANDYGPEELFLNRGEGRGFERARGVGLEESSKSGMSVALGDFQNDGRLGVYVTNISKRGYLFQGNNLRVNRLAARGWMQNVADTVTENCGWAWGAQFGDLDNDGWNDLFVANGFVSANQERDYWYGMTKVATASGALAEDALNWPPMEDRSLSGYERSSVLLNLGANARFAEVSQEVGVDDLYDGRAVALGDLANRGALDVVVANQRGPLLVYANEVDRARRWVQFRLVGTRSNRSAIGAQLVLHAGGRTQVQAVLAGSGFCAQNDLRLHFGLGGLEAVEKAVIRWPSGAEQVVEAPAVGRLHVVEEPR